MSRPLILPGFHEGELAVQQKAGVRAEAARLRRMLDPADLTGGPGRFLAGQRFALLSGRDHEGRLWISSVTGSEGFLEASGPDSLKVHAAPALGGPLHALPAEQPVGMLVIDFAKRRRFRLSGWLAESGDDSLLIEADQAYGNCPQYIQQRDLLDTDRPGLSDDTSGPSGQRGSPTATELKDDQAQSVFSADDRAQIAEADTFFLGTTHPNRGVDASHRGGAPGFVRTFGQSRLWWPDYPGNNMFNSFGNLAVDATAALLFYDFKTGRTLHLAGSATVQHTTPGSGEGSPRTGRRAEFNAEQAVLGPRASLRSSTTAGYPKNPPLDL